jgi:hypothetical protein
MDRSTDDGMGEAFLKNHMTEKQVGPKLGPTFGPKKTLTRGELNDRIMNEDAGEWRGVTEDPDY